MSTSTSSPCWSCVWSPFCFWLAALSPFTLQPNPSPNYMKVVKKTTKMPNPSWQVTETSWSNVTRSTHIRNVIMWISIFVVIVVLVVVGLTYPKCNETQVRGFFRCNCPQGSAFQKSSGLCICLNNGTEMGNQCSEGAADVRYVFSANTENKWKFTQTAIWDNT